MVSPLTEDDGDRESEAARLLFVECFFFLFFEVLDSGRLCVLGEGRKRAEGGREREMLLICFL